MAIGARVTEALIKGAGDDPEGALFDILAAIEETARREGHPRGKAGFKAFIADSAPIITGVGMGLAVAGVSVAGYSHPDLPSSKDGQHDLPDIVYHLMRCALYHTTELSDAIRFTTNQFGFDGDGKILLPRNIVTGLIAAVVVSPANATERIDPGYWIGFLGEQRVVNDLWGKRTEIVQMFADAVSG